MFETPRYMGWWLHTSSTGRMLSQQGSVWAHGQVTRRIEPRQPIRWGGLWNFFVATPYRTHNNTLINYFSESPCTGQRRLVQDSDGRRWQKKARSHMQPRSAMIIIPIRVCVWCIDLIPCWRTARELQQDNNNLVAHIIYPCANASPAG